MNENFSPELSICIDGYLEGTEFDENEVPSPVTPRLTSRKELALAKYKLWEPGQRLRVRCLDGEGELHNKVEQLARRWLEFANLEFEFGNFPDAEIRVTFTGSGYSSLVGTDAMQRPKPQQTMILGGFTTDTDPVEMRRVVLHEFGHAIGCVHEQSSPSINIPWNIDKVYEYYRNRVGWDKAKVDHNVFERYSQSDVHFTPHHDPESIMQYPVPNELTIGDFEIGWNTELSEMDKVFIAKMYPK